MQHLPVSYLNWYGSLSFTAYDRYVDAMPRSMVTNWRFCIYSLPYPDKGSRAQLIYHLPISIVLVVFLM